MGKAAGLTRSSVLCLVLAVAMVACGGGDNQGQTGLRLVATTGILGDIVREVAGADSSVEVLIPPGADPHDYQPSSEQVALLESADLIVVNGLGLEEGLHDVIRAVTSDGGNLLEVGELIDPIAGDPHFWMDPLRVAEAARLVAGRLSTIDDDIDWSGRAESYAQELGALDTRIRATLEPVPRERRKLVTNHEALGYFAVRYGLEVVGVVIPGGSTMGEPSSAQLASLVETIEEEGVPVVFAETTQPRRLADVVADEVGRDVAVVELYTESLGDRSSGAETLIGMLETDARLIAEALQR